MVIKNRHAVHGPVSFLYLVRFWRNEAAFAGLFARTTKTELVLPVAFNRRLARAAGTGSHQFFLGHISICSKKN